MKRILLCTVYMLLHTLAFGQNSDISGGLIFEGEPYMAIDPANPQHITVAWMGFVPLSRVCIKVKTTFNGGASWSSAAVIPHQSPTYTSADVSLAFGRSGDMYACYIDSRQSPDSGGVYVSRSTDGGLTWGAGQLAVSVYADGSKLPIDRPWLAIGKGSGSAPDTLYVTTKPAPWIAAPNRPYFTKSSNNGATWSVIRYIDTTGYRVGNVIQAPMAAPAIDSAGKFHCIYPAYYPAESPYARYIMAAGSTAGAFSYNVVYASASAGGLDTLAKAGSRFICDPKNNKHYAFFILQNTTTDIDISCFETFNAGAAWSGPTRVNNDAAGNGKMQDMVWADFDEHSNIVAAWRDRRNASGPGYQQPSEIWGSIKRKDSANFSANFRISDTIVAYDSVYLSGNGNDFMNVAMAQDTVSAVWGDVRTGVLNIWFSRRNVATGATTVQHLVSDMLPVVRIYPNPTSDFVNVEGEQLENITLYDMTGKMVLSQAATNNTARASLTALPKGNYLINVQTRSGIVSELVIKQ